MVNAQSLSLVFVVALELDLLTYQARCRANTIKVGGQLPRTRDV